MNVLQPLPPFPPHLNPPLPQPLPPPPSTLEEELRDNELGQRRDQSDMSTAFRVQNKGYFFTYAGLTETELNDLPHVLTLVQAWKPNNQMKQYIISREKHQHPADPLREWHIHLFVQFTSPLETTNRTFFDLPGDNGTFKKPYILIPGTNDIDVDKLVAYIAKDGWMMSKLENPFAKSVEEAKKNWGQLLRDAPNAQAAKDLLLRYWPAKYFQHGTTIEHQIAKHHREWATCEYPLESFNHGGFQLKRWTDELKVVVVCGAAGLGKTQAILSEEGYNKIAIVTTPDSLKEAEGADMLVFDEADMTSLGPSENINLVDIEITRKAHARYNDALLPAKVTRVFTTNKSMHENDTIFCSEVARDAITRRIVVIHVVDKLYGIPTHWPYRPWHYGHECARLQCGRCPWGCTWCAKE